jgi:hypothetical protein
VQPSAKTSCAATSTSSARWRPLTKWSCRRKPTVRSAISSPTSAIACSRPAACRARPRENGRYSLDQQKATHARALANYGAAESGQLPPIEQTPDVQKAAAELEQAKQTYQRTLMLQQRQLVAQQLLDDAKATLQAKQAGYDASLQNAKNLRADIDIANASMKLADASCATHSSVRRSTATCKSASSRRASS